MLLGVDEIKVLSTVADEWGIYRLYTNEGDLRRFLLLTCTARQEACYYAERIAAVLRKKYRGASFDRPRPVQLEESEDSNDGNQPEIAVPASDQPSPSIDPPKPPRCKKVMGVGKRIREYFKDGKTDAAIIELLLPDYLAVGRTEEDARWTIDVSLTNAKDEIGREI